MNRIGVLINAPVSEKKVVLASIIFLKIQSVESFSLLVRLYSSSIDIRILSPIDLERTTSPHSLAIDRKRCPGFFIEQTAVLNLEFLALP